MKKAIFMLILTSGFLWGQTALDSLNISHFALNLTVKAPSEGFMKIADNLGNIHFQGLFDPYNDFEQVLVLPLETESIYIALADSLQLFAINDNMSDLRVVFSDKKAGLSQRLLWLKHDLEKVFPIIAFAIIFIIKKHKDRKRQNEDIDV